MKEEEVEPGAATAAGARIQRLHKGFLRSVFFRKKTWAKINLLCTYILLLVNL